MLISSSCEQEDVYPETKPTTEVTPPTEKESNQPKPDNTGIELGNLIGFWDFTGDGNNFIPNQCENWRLPDYDFSDGELQTKATQAEETSFEHANAVNIDRYKWSEARGVNSFKYFSGALKFKISKDQEGNLLSFGLSHRFMHFSLENGHIRIDLPSDNAEMRKHYVSTAKIKYDTWHVLYFRVEEFNPISSGNEQENNIYLQIDKQDTEAFDYGKGRFYKLHSTPLADFDRVMSFDNLSSGKRFQGKCDWVILSNGRMTPGNAQYQLNKLRK